MNYAMIKGFWKHILAAIDTYVETVICSIDVIQAPFPVGSETPASLWNSCLKS